MVFHRPALLYLYSFGDRTHVLLRSKKGKVDAAYLVTDDTHVKMRKKADGEVFEYYEAVLQKTEKLRYSFEVFLKEGKSLTLGPFERHHSGLTLPRGFSIESFTR
ncbi:alpha amylase N-terminal ig-like domain-containing protein [Thermococcus sp. JCM 11816]|uniref:alpha amylase N-terminal ig-like domain-containing protein n=1 Tax=Thermococcus sp. (strain JCM 11816 / KS-1) TaxID=1295125 RepID=UPI003465B637